ncbi:hypothetical protein JMJ56_20570 [Belnapia sp. T18]|uniref:Uncharacterized protein n=1 Tax=Belnapia arida TaxID=2804533 RepID=A0ABS1U799_9PROT|nr:hypothetical protein [Belnapia arida]MBL6080415.1 hypothetical protein [Belnapia arida]
MIAVPSPTRGFGFSDNHGLGALSNTEGFHGDTRNWDWNVTRPFLRQTIDFSYDAFGADDDPMRFTGAPGTRAHHHHRRQARGLGLLRQQPLRP